MVVSRYGLDEASAPTPPRFLTANMPTVSDPAGCFLDFNMNPGVPQDPSIVLQSPAFWDTKLSQNEVAHDLIFSATSGRSVGRRTCLVA